MEWLSAINYARIPNVLLEVRYAKPPRFSEWGSNEKVVDQGHSTHAADRTVRFAVLVDCTYILSRMPAYRLDDEWDTVHGAHNSNFHACSLILKV